MLTRDSFNLRLLTPRLHQRRSGGSPICTNQSDAAAVAASPQVHSWKQHRETRLSNTERARSLFLPRRSAICFPLRSQLSTCVQVSHAVAPAVTLAPRSPVWHIAAWKMWQFAVDINWMSRSQIKMWRLFRWWSAGLKKITADVIDRIWTTNQSCFPPTAHQICTFCHVSAAHSRNYGPEQHRYGIWSMCQDLLLRCVWLCLVSVLFPVLFW